MPYAWLMTPASMVVWDAMDAGCEAAEGAAVFADDDGAGAAATVVAAAGDAVADVAGVGGARSAERWPKDRAAVL